MIPQYLDYDASTDISYYRIKACLTGAICSDFSNADSGFLAEEQLPTNNLDPSYDDGVLNLPVVAVTSVFDTLYYEIELELIDTTSNIDFIVSSAESIPEVVSSEAPTFSAQDNTLFIPEIIIVSTRYSLELQLVPESSPPTFRLTGYQEL